MESATRRRGAVLTVGLLASTTLAILPTALTAPADGVTAPKVISTTHKHGGYVTVIDQPDGKLRVFSTEGTVSAASASAVTTSTVRRATRTGQATSYATVTQHGVGGQLTVHGAGKAQTAAPVNVSSAQALQDIGVSPADAAQFAAGFDAAPRSTKAVTRAGVSMATSSVDQIQPRSVTCFSKKPDNGAMYIYVCDRQYLVWRSKTSPGVWGLEDKFKISAKSIDRAIFNSDMLSGALIGNKYPRGNTIIDYRPDQTYVPRNDCEDKSYSMKYKDIEISTSTAVCKSQMGPIDFDATHFSVKWDGKGNGVDPFVVRSATGIDSVYNRSWASPDRTLYWHIWWV